MRRSVIFLFFLVLCFLSACTDIDAPNNPQPILTVEDASGITRESAVLSGDIIIGSMQSMLQLNFKCTSEDGTVLRTIAVEPENGHVSCSVDGLETNTKYSFYLSSNNGRTEIKSEIKHFTTENNIIPTISNLTPLSKGPASLIASFEIEDNGGESIISAGCYIYNTITGITVKSLLPQPIKENEVQRLCLTNLDKLSTLEITPFALNSVGEAVGEKLIISTDNTINLTQAGLLASLMKEDKNHYSYLAISGYMNGDDICFLRTMQLIDINIADSYIVEGGGAYIPSRFTATDVIGYGMFEMLQDLKSITLPNSVNKIEEQSFKDCSSLASITIPANVVSLLPSDGCISLSEINVSPANNDYSSVDGVLYNNDISSIVWFPLGKKGDYVLPNTIKTIGAYAFRGSNINSMTMAGNVTSIGQAAFFESKICKVVLSDNITALPQATFQNCSQLTEIHIGSKTNLIGEYVFDGCPLKDMYVTAFYPPVCYDNTFSNSTYNLFDSCVLHVPSSSVGIYRNHPKWGKFKCIETDD